MPIYFDAENVPETSAADSEIRGLQGGMVLSNALVLSKGNRPTTMFGMMGGSGPPILWPSWWKL